MQWEVHRSRCVALLKGIKEIKSVPVVLKSALVI